jgi:membrane fusion protein (multidrug efflux system)
MVAAGTAVFTLVETGDLWVDANFKETQLADMKPGQKAEVIFDFDPEAPSPPRSRRSARARGPSFRCCPRRTRRGTG